MAPALGEGLLDRADPALGRIRPNSILNVVVCIVGSWIGGQLIAPLIGGAGFMGYVSAFLGALVLLAIVNLFRRGRVR